MGTSVKQVAYLIVTFTGPRLVQTMKTLSDLARVMVIDNSVTGWSLSKAWNHGINRLIEEGYEAVVVCNDDIELREDTGQLLAEALLTRQFTDERPEKDRLVLLISAYNTRDQEDIGPRWGTGPDFSCFCVGRSLFDQVGGFDERFYPCFFEDNDMHQRINLSGFSALSYAPYYHHGSQSINFRDDTVPLMSRAVAQRSKVVANGTFENCKSYYVSKWGGTPGEEVFSQPFNGGAR
jgi:GT2 family glycosyltransferase